MTARSLRRAISTAAALTLTGAALTVSAGAAHADGGTIASCDVASIQAAIDAGGTWSIDPCNGQTLSQTDGSPLTVNGTDVTLTASGRPTLQFTGTTEHGGGAVFQVNSGSLTVVDVDIEGTLTSVASSQPAQGGAVYVAPGASFTLDRSAIIHSSALGYIGADGAAGVQGGDPDGQPGEDGSVSEGGGLYNAGTTTIIGGQVSNNTAGGGHGGDGGDGARGVDGVDHEFDEDGMPGGDATRGGNGGDAGHPRPAYGAGIFNAGTLTITSSQLAQNLAYGGGYTSAGSAGVGGIGGIGSGGSNGAGGTSSSPDGGNGTPGMRGGRGGDGGSHTGRAWPAGDADGGGLYNGGTATVYDVSFIANQLIGGDIVNGGSAGIAGHGGAGGYGGAGGDGYSPGTNPGKAGNGGNGADAGAVGPPGAGGVAAQDGGNGGQAHGAGIYDATGQLSVAASVFAGDKARGGLGGNGGHASVPDDGGYFYSYGGEGGGGGFGGSVFKGRGGNAGSSGRGGDGVDPLPGFAAGNGGNGGDASALAIYTVGGAAIGCSSISEDGKDNLTAGIPLGAGGAGRGLMGSAGGRGGAKAYGGSGHPKGTNGAAGAHGHTGVRKPIAVPGGTKGKPGVKGPAGIDGGHTGLPCDRLTPSSLSMEGVINHTSNKTATLHNTGSADLTVSSVDITGAPPSVLSASGCNQPVPAGGSCVITVSFTPSQTGEVDATLTVHDNSTLGAVSIPVTATAASSAHDSALATGPAATIPIGAHKPLGTTLTDATTGAPIGGAKVDLQAKAAGASSYTPLDTVTTNGNGKASTTVSPTVNTTYRWTYSGSGIHSAATSNPQAVSVAQVVNAAVTKAKVKKGKKITVYGAVAPDEAGHKVQLEQQQGTTWKPLPLFAVIKQQTLPNGVTAAGFIIKFTATHKGETTYRVHSAATTSNAAGDSGPVTVKVIKKKKKHH
jgi:hypothetical protein